MSGVDAIATGFTQSHCVIPIYSLRRAIGNPFQRAWVALACWSLRAPRASRWVALQYRWFVSSALRSHLLSRW